MNCVGGCEAYLLLQRQLESIEAEAQFTDCCGGVMISWHPDNGFIISDVWMDLEVGLSTRELGRGKTILEALARANILKN